LYFDGFSISKYVRCLKQRILTFAYLQFFRQQIKICFRSVNLANACQA